MIETNGDLLLRPYPPPGGKRTNEENCLSLHFSFYQKGLFNLVHNDIRHLYILKTKGHLPTSGLGAVELRTSA